MRKDLRNVLVSFSLVLLTAFVGGAVYASMPQQPAVDATAVGAGQPIADQMQTADGDTTVLIGTSSTQSGNTVNTPLTTNEPSSGRSSSPRAIEPALTPVITNKQPTRQVTTTPPPPPPPQPVAVQTTPAPDPVPTYRMSRQSRAS